MRQQNFFEVFRRLIRALLQGDSHAGKRCVRLQVFWSDTTIWLISTVTGELNKQSSP